jgi:hypothetical protein
MLLAAGREASGRALILESTSIIVGQRRLAWVGVVPRDTGRLTPFRYEDTPNRSAARGPNNLSGRP